MHINRVYSAAALLLGAVLFGAVSALAIPSVQNPSAEAPSSADPQTPDAWQPEAWGGVSSFEHTWTSAGAFDGARALRVAVGKISGEGDARWISTFSDVTADAGETFSLHVRYRSNAAANVVAHLTDDKGAKSQWLFIGPAPVAAGWSPFAANFTLPSWAAKMRVAVALAQPGWLETDAWSIEAKIPAPTTPEPDPLLPAVSPVEANILPNPSFEDASIGEPQRPAWWTYSEWGDATSASGAWISTGGAVDGSRFVRLLQAKLPSDGDAKWTSASIPLSELGGTLRLTCSYRGAPLELLVRAAASGDAKVQWISVAEGPQWTDWRILSGTFKLPSFTNQVQVGLVARGQGTTDIDACSLSQAGAPASPVVHDVGEQNIVANPSLELADPWDPGRPADWSPVIWGDLEGSATWALDALDGARAGHVSVSAKAGGAEGDAGWRSAPIVVSGPARVLIRNRYQSTTETFLRLHASDGAKGSNTGWFASAPLPASPAGWSTGELVVQLPPWATHLEIVHTLNTNGSLSVDAFSLVDAGPAPVEPAELGVDPTPTAALVGAANIVPNASFEGASKVDPQLPYFWGGSSWGAAQATFSWQDEGFDGQRSVSLGLSFPDGGTGSAQWSSRMFVITPRATWARIQAAARGTGTLELWLASRDKYGDIRWTPVTQATLGASWAMVAGTVAIRADAEALAIVASMRTSGAMQLDAVSLIEAAAPVATDQGSNETDLTQFDPGPKGVLPADQATSGCTAGSRPGGSQALWLLLIVAAGWALLRRRRSATPMVLLIMLATGLLLQPASASAVNLVANPGAEGAGGVDDTPLGWSRVVWGDVAATLTWSDAVDGSRSLALEVHGGAEKLGSDSDAYWLSDAIALPAGGTYRVRLRYKSSVKGRILAQALVGKQSTWRLVAQPVAAPEWTTTEGLFTLPDGASHVRIAFALSGIGTLATDDYGLEIEPVPAQPWNGAAGTELANGGFEAAAAVPALRHDEGKIPGWSFSLEAGTGTGAIADDGAAEGKRYATMNVTSLSSGGHATWRSDAMPVAADGELWALRLRCRASAALSLLVIEELAQGGTRFQRLQRVRPLSDPELAAQNPWRDAGSTFVVGGDVRTIRVAFALGTPGRVDLDAVTLGKAASYGDATQPARVSIALDAPDGDVTAVLDVLRGRGVVGSVYLPSNRLGAASATPMATLTQAEVDGFEVGAYGDDVASWVNDSGEGWRASVLRAYARFAEAGLSAHGFAAPGGAIDSGALELVDGSEGYLRTLETGFNLEPFDYLRVVVRDVHAGISAETVDAWVAEARRHGGWIVLRYGGQGTDGKLDHIRLGSDIDRLLAAGATFSTVGGTLGMWQAPPPLAEGALACSANPAGSGPLRAHGTALVLLLLGFVVVVQSRRKWQV